jgi:hypothetical protein
LFTFPNLIFLRVKQSNLIVFGIHVGEKKPSISPYFKKAVHILRELETDGVLIGDQRYKVRLGAGIFDGPARCLVLGIRQFNWKHGGCHCCRHPGVQHNRTRYYPFRKSYTSRSNSLIRECMKTCQTSPQSLKEIEENSSSNPDALIVKNCSPVTLLKQTHLVNDFPCDPHHVLFNNTFPRIVEFIFSRDSSKFWLKNKKKTLDVAWCALKLPSEITNHPRSYYSSKNLWRCKSPYSPKLNLIFFLKAAEFATFVLDFLPMVISEMMSTKWSENFLNLIDSVRILYDSFKKSEIGALSKKMNKFLEKMPKFFHSISLTVNFHSLVHLPFYAEIWGSLAHWHSFPYERLNGFFKKKIHGTRYHLDQMVWHLQLSQLLEEFSLLPADFK